MSYERELQTSLFSMALAVPRIAFSGAVAVLVHNHIVTGDPQQRIAHEHRINRTRNVNVEREQR